MVEANPIKFYLAKYSLLAFAVLQWLAGAVLLYLDEFTPFNLAIDGLFIIIGICLVILFIKVREKIKRVAIGKNKFVIREGQYNVRFEWPEVKSLRIMPIINLCKVKFRGKKGTFYFFSSSRFKSALERLSLNSQEGKKKDFNFDNPSLS